MREHGGSPDATIALAASDVTVLIDASEGRLPAVQYWGRELPGLDAAQAAGLAGASASVLGSNNLEPVPRVAVLPEHCTGWTGRPGLRGSFAGSGWSPAFRTTSIRLDGAPVAGFAAAGPGSVEVLAVDDSGRLELRIVLELLPSGLLRGRAAVRNLAGRGVPRTRSRPSSATGSCTLIVGGITPWRMLSRAVARSRAELPA